MIGDMGLSQTESLWHLDFTSLPQVCSIKINLTGESRQWWWWWWLMTLLRLMVLMNLHGWRHEWTKGKWGAYFTGNEMRATHWYPSISFGRTHDCARCFHVSHGLTWKVISHPVKPCLQPCYVSTQRKAARHTTLSVDAGCPQDDRLRLNGYPLSIFGSVAFLFSSQKF